MVLLTKSKYLNGLESLRYLWILFNASDRIPPFNTATLHKFEQGHAVGELAKKAYPHGIDVPTDDFMGNLRKTKELLKKRVPLFEGGFMVDNLFSRVDILNPVEGSDDEWDIIEVKSSTQVKDVNIEDVSFQLHCCRKAGLNIRKCFLMHVNNEFVKNGEINPEEFFIIEEVSDQVDGAIVGIDERVKLMFDTIKLKECPSFKINDINNSPYGNPTIDEFYDNLPKNNVFELYRGKKQAQNLYNEGIVLMRDIPDEYKLSDKQRVQRDSVILEKPHINKEGIKEFLNTLQHPLYYFDFETINSAIPLFDGTRPYQQIPFQFSVHIVSEDGSIEHKAFLAEGKEDPRPEILKAMKDSLGDKGSIIVFNQAFEISRLKELADSFPEYADWAFGIIARIVDLILPFRNFHYYSPEQKGSASIKKVLPAITGKGYDNLDINNGEDAFISFMKVTYGNVPESERLKVRKNLEEYCKLDTEGMIWIVDELKKMTGN